MMERFENDIAHQSMDKHARDIIESGDNSFLRPPRRSAYEVWPTPLTAANDNNKLPQIVALAGAAGSGKSTLADYMVERHGYQRIKFAGPVKAMCRALGMTDAMLEGELKEVGVPWLEGRSPRYIMQRLGGEWGREMIGPDLWTGLWVKAVSDALVAGKRVVVDDCRYDNEAEAARSLGGVVIQLQGRGGIDTTHPSEAGVDADLVLHNVAGITDLQARADEALFGGRW